MEVTLKREKGVLGSVRRVLSIIDLPQGNVGVVCHNGKSTQWHLLMRPCLQPL